jgi:hypothetical protein
MPHRLGMRPTDPRSRCMTLSRRLAVAVLLMGAASAWSDNDDPHIRLLVAKSYFVHLFTGQSLTVLGSEDRRTGFGLGFAYGRPEKRFAAKGVGAQIVYEVYWDHTSSRGASGRGPNQAESLGGLAYGRWRWPMHRNLGFYACAGWGLQWTNRTSVDLDSQLNSTPMVGLGVSFDTGRGEGSVGLRFIHISNAGFVGSNQGQNQLFLDYSWRF